MIEANLAQYLALLCLLHRLCNGFSPLFIQARCSHKITRARRFLTAKSAGFGAMEVLSYLSRESDHCHSLLQVAQDPRNDVFLHGGWRVHCGLDEAPRLLAVPALRAPAIFSHPLPRYILMYIHETVPTDGIVVVS